MRSVYGVREGLHRLFRQMLAHRRLDRGNESEIVMSIEVPTFISQRMLLLEVCVCSHSRPRVLHGRLNAKVLCEEWLSLEDNVCRTRGVD